MGWVRTDHSLNPTLAKKNSLERGVVFVFVGSHQVGLLLLLVELLVKL